jgi:hypothetical protein
MNADSSNKPSLSNQRDHGGGLKAGVESGLGFVEKLPKGAIQPEQMTHGETFRQECADSEAGAGFKFRY